MDFLVENPNTFFFSSSAAGRRDGGGIGGPPRLSASAGGSNAAEALALCLSHVPDAILMDVQLAGEMNGIEAAVAMRREFPRLPVVFYSIQDDDAYYRDFRRSGILSHYAYVRKSNYLLPQMIVPLLRDAVAGRSFIDPEIESRVQEVRHKDEQSPMALLEPNEQAVARMLAQGLTNEQIAARMGFRDKRTISRTNGQIYAAWGLNDTTTDEKVARTRAAHHHADGPAAHLGRRRQRARSGCARRLGALDGRVSAALLRDWLLLALSLFNTLVAAWLGLTVLLNAERPTTGGRGDSDPDTAARATGCREPAGAGDYGSPAPAC